MDLNFTIKDGGVPKTYKWYVFFKETGDRSWNSPNTGSISGISEHPGKIHALWSGEAENLNSPLLSSGTYTFDILVIKDENGDGLFPIDAQGDPNEDHMWYRSDYTYFQDHDLNAIDSDDSHLTATYTLPQNKSDVSAIHLTSIDGNWEVKSTIDGPTATGVENQVEVPVLSNSGAFHHLGAVIFSGVDSNASLYRDHLNRRLLAVNLKSTYHKAFLFEGPDEVANLPLKFIRLAPATVKTARGIGTMVQIDRKTAADGLTAKQVNDWFGDTSSTSSAYKPWLVHLAAHGLDVAGDAMVVSATPDQYLYFDLQVENNHPYHPDGSRYEGNSPETVENIWDNPPSNAHFVVLDSCNMAHGSRTVPTYGLMNGLIAKGTNAVLGFRVNTCLSFYGGFRAGTVYPSVLFFDHFYTRAGINKKQVGVNAQGKAIFQSYTLDESLSETNTWWNNQVLNVWGFYANNDTERSDQYYGLDSAEIRVSPAYANSMSGSYYSPDEGACRADFPIIYLFDVAK